MVKNPPGNAGDVRDVGSQLGQEDPIEEGTVTHSSSLTWRIPWAEEPGGSIGCKESDTTEATQHEHIMSPGSSIFWELLINFVDLV